MTMPGPNFNKVEGEAALVVEKAADVSLPQAGDELVDVVELEAREVADKIEADSELEAVRARVGLETGGLAVQQFLSQLPQENGFLDFTQLQRVGGGGTHDVYLWPADPAFVIKLNRGALAKAQGVGQETLPPEIKAQAEAYAEGENRKNAELYKYFGAEHCLREQVLVQQLKVDGTSPKIEGIVSVQEGSDVFKDPNRKDFSTGYVEQTAAVTENKVAYDKMNVGLLGAGEFDETSFLACNEKADAIFQLIDNDDKFAATMKEFLLRFKSYFEETGRFIDLVGQENVLFHQEEGNWTFTLGSVVKGETSQVMETALGALEVDPESINNDPALKGQLMNQLALIRLLNATGLKVGLGKLIDVELSAKQLENLDKIKF